MKRHSWALFSYREDDKYWLHAVKMTDQCDPPTQWRMVDKRRSAFKRLLKEKGLCNKKNITKMYYDLGGKVVTPQQDDSTG